MLEVKAIFCKELVGTRMFSFLTLFNISSFEEKVSRIIEKFNKFNQQFYFIQFKMYF